MPAFLTCPQRPKVESAAHISLPTPSGAMRWLPGRHRSSEVTGHPARPTQHHLPAVPTSSPLQGTAQRSLQHCCPGGCQGAMTASEAKMGSVQRLVHRAMSEPHGWLLKWQRVEHSPGWVWGAGPRGLVCQFVGNRRRRVVAHSAPCKSPLWPRA